MVALRHLFYVFTLDESYVFDDAHGLKMSISITKTI